MSTEFGAPGVYHQYERNHFLYGRSCTEQLGTLLDEIEAERPMLVHGEHVGANEAVMEPVEAAIGDRLVCRYDGVRPKTPKESVERGVEHKREHDADCVISVGGGSASDTAKAIVAKDAEDRPWTELESTVTEDGALEIPPMPEPKDPVIAVPTTLSAAEVSEAFGVTDFEREQRMVLIDEKVRSTGCVYDPELVETTPPSVLASSGMNALDHAVEIRYSAATGDNPFYQATAEKAITMLFEHLEPAVKGETEAIEQVLYGAALSGLGIIGGYCINHAMNHVVCGYHDVSHGDGNSILLPHGIRYNFEAVPDRVMAIADAMGIESADSDRARMEQLLDELDELQRALDVPRSLSEAGVEPASDEHIREMAEHAAADPGMASNPRPVTADDAFTILKDAW